MIQAIRVRYGGVLFRSRTEARWAVLFDALGLRWVYEQEAFVLSSGERYLPDFWLPDVGGVGVYAEVKPERGDFTKAQALASESGMGVLLCSGMAGEPESMSWAPSAQRVERPAVEWFRKAAETGAIERARGVVRAWSFWDPEDRAEKFAPPKPAKAGVAPPTASLDARYVAAVLSAPQILALDVLRAAVELDAPELRVSVLELSSGRPAEDVLYSLPDPLRVEVEAALADQPRDAEVFRSFFASLCRRLKLRGVDRELAYIASATGKVVPGEQLSEDLRDLIQRRGAMLEQRKLLMGGS